MGTATSSEDGFYVVTGAFGYSGRYITARLLTSGKRIRTLTNSPGRAHPLGTAVEARPYNFEKPDELAESLRGARALVNTYWVRFDHGDFSHAQAVRNTLKLFEAARRAGVPRIVHVSITNPDAASRLPYFRGKAELEAALRGLGLSYAILRPAVLFGPEDILINNIAWMLRRFPVFGLFGDGNYRIQPMFVEDFACLAVDAAEDSSDLVIDAIGPETFTYHELVTTIGKAIGHGRPLIPMPPSVALAFARVLGPFLGDVVITRDEIAGLMENRLWTQSPPAGSTALTGWASAHRETLGLQYSSELARRRDRQRSYAELRRRP